MVSAFEACKDIFGVATISRAGLCEKNEDAIVDLAAIYLKEQLESAESFKVESKRADKSFHMISTELSQYVGGFLQDRFPHLKPQLRDPDFTVFVEIRELAAYVHGPAVTSSGGLPVGTGGSMVALLSGGIDSPVAMHMIAKRGVSLIPVHFESKPYTSELATEKIFNLVKILSATCGDLTVNIVPFTKISEEIRKKCPEALITIVMRRFMMRIAELIALKHGCAAIVTGDNLGQVASQTVEALAVVEECVSLPVLRPLIAFDKLQIIDSARKIGTFDTSILPYEDCCSVFTPRHPKTKPKLPEVLKAESRLDISALVDDAVNGIIRG
jgi:thiamine biosynthesis protein ThiI